MREKTLKVKYDILNDPMEIISTMGQASNWDLIMDNYSGSELSVHLDTLLKKAEFIRVMIENKKTSDSDDKDLFKFIRLLHNHRKKIEKIEYSGLSEKSEALLKKICSNIIKR